MQPLSGVFLYVFTVFMCIYGIVGFYGSMGGLEVFGRWQFFTGEQGVAYIPMPEGRGFTLRLVRGDDPSVL